MSVYHQMGEKSHSLLFEPGLSRFKGAVLSPVNDDWAALRKLAHRCEENPAFELIFDPQLYVPQAGRGRLPQWEYFPSDVDTADLGSIAWWEGVTTQLVSTCEELGVHSICSPNFIPKRFDNTYFDLSVRLGAMLAKQLSGIRIQPIQTAVVGLTELTDRARTLEIASILSRTKSDRMYLVLVSDVDPRREMSDPDQIAGAMNLISSLERADISVLVGYSAHDMVLWKAAGASHVASGKFFNLRRFTRSRFDEPKDGGSQLPYWFEEGLLALLRESDVLRIEKEGRICEASQRNPYCGMILEQMKNEPGTPWIALGWRQYLYGLADLEHRIETSRVDVRGLLKDSEAEWQALEDVDVLMEERRNNGDWLRAWRRALAEYRK